MVSSTSKGERYYSCWLEMELHLQLRTVRWLQFERPKPEIWWPGGHQRGLGVWDYPRSVLSYLKRFFFLFCWHTSESSFNKRVTKMLNNFFLNLTVQLGTLCVRAASPCHPMGLILKSVQHLKCHSGNGNQLCSLEEFKSFHGGDTLPAPFASVACSSLISKASFGTGTVWEKWRRLRPSKREKELGEWVKFFSEICVCVCVWLRMSYSFKGCRLW